MFWIYYNIIRLNLIKGCGDLFQELTYCAKWHKSNLLVNEAILSLLEHTGLRCHNQVHMSDNTKHGDHKTSDQQAGISLTIEYYNQDIIDAISADEVSRGGSSSFNQLLVAVRNSLRNEDLPKTRLVLTNDLVASVNDRENRTVKEFTVERGAGVVAAKTMPPNAEGLVDILLPIHWVLPLVDSVDERDEYMQHLVAHEAVHASLFHIGAEPFDLHHRKKFDYAMYNFISMASEQIEEHLAEYIGSKVTKHKIKQTADQVNASINTWQETLSIKLPAISQTSPDYFERGMLTTFEALHILWKSLAYLAAALRTDDKFNQTPSEITDLPKWKEYIGPWWPHYLELLSKIPMTIEVDIPATDKVVYELALYLQRWADDIGFDFHDSEQGAYFRIKNINKIIY